MAMANARKSTRIELVNRVLNAEAAPLNQITNDQESGAVVAIVSMDADQRTGQSLVLPLIQLRIDLLLQPIDQSDEVPCLVRSRRDL